MRKIDQILVKHHQTRLPNISNKTAGEQNYFSGARYLLIKYVFQSLEREDPKFDTRSRRMKFLNFFNLQSASSRANITFRKFQSISEIFDVLQEFCGLSINSRCISKILENYFHQRRHTRMHVLPNLEINLIKCFTFFKIL